VGSGRKNQLVLGVGRGSETLKENLHQKKKEGREGMWARAFLQKGRGGDHCPKQKKMREV